MQGLNNPNPNKYFYINSLSKIQTIFIFTVESIGHTVLHCQREMYNLIKMVY